MPPRRRGSQPYAKAKAKAAAEPPMCLAEVNPNWLTASMHAWSVWSYVVVRNNLSDDGVVVWPWIDSLIHACTNGAMRTFEQMILFLSNLLPFPPHVESCTQWVIVSIDLRLHRNVWDLLVLSCCILPTTLPTMDGGYKVMQDECFEHPLMACSPQSLTFDWHRRAQKMQHYILNSVHDSSFNLSHPWGCGCT